MLELSDTKVYVPETRARFQAMAPTLDALFKDLSGPRTLLSQTECFESRFAEVHTPQIRQRVLYYY